MIRRFAEDHSGVGCREEHRKFVCTEREVSSQGEPDTPKSWESHPPQVPQQVFNKFFLGEGERRQRRLGKKREKGLERPSLKGN